MVRRDQDSIGTVDNAWEPPDHLDNSVSRFLKHVSEYGETGKVPEMTSHLQASWAMYDELWKLLHGLNNVDELPNSLESVSRFIIESLQKFKIDDDITELLKCYEFPLPKTTTFKVSFIETVDAPLFSLNTLAVGNDDIGDGDGFIVWAKVNDYSQVPVHILMLMQDFNGHQKKNKHHLAKIVRSKIERVGYSCLLSEDGLSGWIRKYSIRLRGIDSPEMKQDYGDKARVELANLIASKCLTVHVYYIDEFKRCVADVYCDNNLVQKTLLEKGAAWHYKLYDSREELVKCELLAKKNKVGLWAYPNPMPPWEWKRSNPR
ncbi:putative staphylococcal nuclease (SNase-like), SNase-like, superfamily [Helianthus debilis subsp. tardiflorus]